MIKSAILILVTVSLTIYPFVSVVRADDPMPYDEYRAFIAWAYQEAHTSRSQSRSECAATLDQIADELEAVTAVRMPDNTVMPVEHCCGIDEALRATPCDAARAAAYLMGICPGCINQTDGSSFEVVEQTPDSGDELPGDPDTDDSDQGQAVDDSGGASDGRDTGQDADDSEQGQLSSDDGEQPDEQDADQGGQGQPSGDGGQSDGQGGGQGGQEQPSGDGEQSDGQADGQGEQGQPSGDGEQPDGQADGQGEQGQPSDDGEQPDGGGDGQGEQGQPSDDEEQSDGQADSQNEQSQASGGDSDGAATDQSGGPGSGGDDQVQPSEQEPGGDDPKQASKQAQEIPVAVQVAVALGFLVLVVGLAVWMRRAPEPETDPDDADDDGEDDEDDEDDVTSPVEAVDRAQQLIAVRDYRAAIRHLFLAALLVLDERKLLRFDHSLTNHELLRDTQANPTLSAALTPVTVAFDRVWYGFEALTQSDYETLVEQIESLKQL